MLTPWIESIKILIRLRKGTEADIPEALRLLDIATEWLASQDRAGQWGETCWQDNPRQIARMAEMATTGEFWVAETGTGTGMLGEPEAHG